ncbi:MAG: chondroitinase-B domain-containing protein [Polaribacter sp.]
MKYIFNIFFLVFSIGFLQAQTVNNQTQLNTAIANASAGSTIILANGTYSNLQININKNGTSSSPISIKAETVGQVFIEGKSNIQMGGSYILFEGFVFRNASNLVVSSDRIESLITFRSNGNECNNCTVTNIKIDSYNGTTTQNEAVFKWILLYGSYNEISHSSFIGKNGIGSIINDNRSDNLADYHKIHHNYFASRKAVGNVNDLNDQDAIRIGVSTTSLSDSFTEIYDNFFYDWEGEVEIISNKSGKNKYYNNTFRDYSGTLTLRHGNGCEVFNNYFLANNRILSGGIRVIGEDHKIYNNYISGVNALKPNGSRASTTGAINISNGRPNSELSGYFQVKNLTVVNNTFVDCDYGFRVGTKVKSDLTLAPENIVLANNIMLNTSTNAFDIQTNATGNSKSEGNITQNGSWDLTNGVDNNQTVTSVKIYFHKGDSRTSDFKIALSDDGTTFTDITSVLTSSGNTIGFEDFPLPANTKTRYVRILGYGNSEASGWNSYEEVAIFGEANCPSLSVKNDSLKELGITIYPIPTNNGFLNIKSQQENLGKIEVFDIRGKSLLIKKVENVSTKIDIQNLSKGIYIIKIKNTFSRFVVN